MRKLLLLLAVGILAACGDKKQTASYSVIPLPQEINLTQGEPFVLNDKVVVAYPAGNLLLKRNAEFLSEYVEQAVGHPLKTKAMAEGEKSANAITLALNSEIENEEGYRIVTAEEGVRIEGKTENGVFYGIQTLRKSVPASALGCAVSLPAGVVNDEPRFGYRGMHLDVGRHFFLWNL